MAKGCDSCEVVTINGVATHEHRCINSSINPATGRKYEIECKWCGRKFTPKASNSSGCCSKSCSNSYFN